MIEEIKRVLKGGQFILGKEVEALEKEVAEYCKVKYAVGVNSGTDALLLALKALNIKGEVITTPFTFIATAESIVNAGAKLVFCDIGEDLNIDASLIKVSKKTEAILPVHLFGREPNQEIYEIAKDYGLFVIEDMAQAFGNRLRGEVGCLSFYPTKILGACGDAGMVITNNKYIANNIRLLRNHGSSKKNKYLNLTIGINSRLDEIQAAILRYKLKHFNPKGFSYDKAKYYSRPLHLQPCFRYLGYKKGDFPQAERAANKVKNNKTKK